MEASQEERRWDGLSFAVARRFWLAAVNQRFPMHAAGRPPPSAAGLLRGPRDTHSTRKRHSAAYADKHATHVGEPVKDTQVSMNQRGALEQLQGGAKYYQPENKRHAVAAPAHCAE